MALTTSLLLGAVYQQHLVNFPTAVQGRRTDPVDSTKTFNVNFAYFGALCEALVASAKRLTILDLSAGTGVSGVAVPATFLLPAASAAVPSFLQATGWTGRDAFKFSDVAIRVALQQVAFFGRLQMSTPNLAVGVGSGIVAPVNNSQLLAQAIPILNAELYAAFKNSGKFGASDDPSGEPTVEVLRRLPDYAAAYAKGLASITASVAYTGVAGAPSGGVNFGSIQ